jgi:hypothetical protein
MAEADQASRDESVCLFSFPRPLLRSLSDRRFPRPVDPNFTPISMLALNRAGQ